jgi:hypothetical protein
MAHRAGASHDLLFGLLALQNGMVNRAAAAGYRNPAAYRTESALDPLRDRDDFRLLMLDLAMPADPFAPPQ